MEKFVITTDRHVGWEKRRIRGKLQTCPTHDPRLANNVVEFIKDFKPDHFYDLGDWLNMSPVSRHNRNKPRLTEGFSLKREYDYANQYQFVPLEEALPEHCTRTILKGNHEFWIELLKDEHPELDDLLDPYLYLDLEARDWRIIEYGDSVKISKKLYATHGDNLRSSAMYVAGSLMKNYPGKNVVSGHFHTAQMLTSKSLATETSHVTYTLPMMGDPNAEYISRAPSQGVQGFAYGYIHNSSGMFNLYPVMATNGKFAIEGKLYG